MIFSKTYDLESLDDLGKVNNNVIHSVGDYVSMDEKVQYNVKLVISELVINGFVHGKNNDLKLNVVLDENKALVITVDDGGVGFDTSKRADYARVDSECGRGLILVRAFTDNVSYNETGNIVKVTMEL